MNKRIYFIAVCMMMFAANFANSLLGILLSDYIAYYDLASASQGYMSTVQSIGCIVSCFLILFLASRLKRWQVLIGCGVLIGGAMLLIGTKLSFPLLLCMYFLIGIGYSATTNVASSLASELFRGEASAMGLVHVFFGLGGLLAPLVLHRARLHMDWNLVCVLDGAVVMAVLLLYLLVTVCTQKTIRWIPENGSHIHAAEIRGFLRSRRNILLILGTFGYMAFQNGINVWIARYFGVELGAEALGALTLSVFWIGNAVARLTMTRLKIRTELLFGLGCIGSFAALGMGMLIGTPAAMLVCIAVCGLTSGASIPQIYHMGCVWNDGNSLIPTSVLGLAMWVSCVASSPLTAYLAGYGLDFAMCSILFYGLFGGVVMLPLMWNKKDRKDKRSRLV